MVAAEIFVNTALPIVALFVTIKFVVEIFVVATSVPTVIPDDILMFEPEALVNTRFVVVAFAVDN